LQQSPRRRGADSGDFPRRCPPGRCGGTAQRNFDFGFDLAKNFAGANNLFDILELQAAYWQKHFDTFTSQAEDVRDRQCEFGAAKKAARSPESLHHGSTSPSLGRETPNPGLNPATRDAEGLKQSPIKVRTSDETQSRTRKEGTVEAVPRRRQRSTFRVSAAESGGPKLEPPSPSVVVAEPERGAISGNQFDRPITPSHASSKTWLKTSGQRPQFMI
jgi:hypothetical protein